MKYQGSEVDVTRALDPSIQRLAIRVLERAMRDAAKASWPHRYGNENHNTRARQSWWSAKYGAYRLIFTGNPATNGLSEWCMMAGTSIEQVRGATGEKLRGCSIARKLGWVPDSTTSHRRQ